MKIQYKITWVTTSLFGMVFLIGAIVIYFAFDTISKNIFYSELARTAKIAGMFYLEEDELTKAQFQPIADKFYNLNPEQKVSIYDENDKTAFNTKENKSQSALPLLNKIRTKGKLNFKTGDNYYHGLYYKDNQGNFVVVVKAKNELIQSQLRNLIFILISSFLLGMIVLFILTLWLSKLVYQPVRHTINQVNALNLNQNSLSLSYKHTGDELEELISAFNGLLKKIETTYRQQKNFIDYASHELKTPLATIINQTEVSLKRTRTSEEYQETIDIILHEAEGLQLTLKNLLIFSGINRTAHQKAYFRIDELLWEVIEQLNMKYKSHPYQVNINLKPEESSYLKIYSNKSLITMAILNFLDNAAKFSSPNPVKIDLIQKNNHLQMAITDKGIGISEDDLTKISQPFFRAKNAMKFEGHGLGMSIALKVLETQKISYKFESQINVGTTINLIF